MASSTGLCDCMGLPVTCSSEEALQWYNKGVFALLTMRESPHPYLKKALELDPSFILTHCFLGCVGLLEFNHPTDAKVAPYLEVVKSADHEKITEREKGHVKAFLAYSSGNLPQAIEQWAMLVVDYPHDVHILPIFHRCCSWLGAFPKMRDTFARILPHWTEEMPLYPYVASLYAFGLEQTNRRKEAEGLVRRALGMERQTPWATHTLSHVIEEEQDATKGVEFLTSTREDWKHSLFGGHITWHLSLYHLDVGDTDAALHEFDTVLYHRATPENLLALVDATSLLWRLEILGVDPGEKRWEKVTENFAKAIGKHKMGLYDIHLMMSLAHGKVSESAARLALCEQMFNSMRKFVESNVSTHCKITDMVSIPVCNAVLAYARGQYDEVLSLMLPLRYDFVRLGGSFSQRQICNLTLIQAAINGKKTSLALALVAELKARKPESRLLAKLFQELKVAYDKERKILDPKRLALDQS